MGIKYTGIKNFLCLALCASIISGSVLSREFIGETAYLLAGKLGGIKSFVIEAGSTLNEGSLNNKAEKVFSPFGFGGGGFKTQNITETPADIIQIKSEAKRLYSSFEKDGTIKEQSLGGGNASYGNIKVNNKTDETVNIQMLLNRTPEYGNITKKEPYILVYHTHTTESYELLDLGWYSNSLGTRNNDNGKNMVRVGEELVKYLEKAGFKVIHDKNIYDKSYNGAYDRSRKSVEKHMEKYPSIKITLDVHRDAIHYDGGVKAKPTTTVLGKKAAQVMIITGCEGDGVSGFPNWEKNLVFALALQNKVEENYSGLMRPVFFCNRKYNMNLTECSLLLEFGTDANTLEEAVYSAALIGKSMGEMLNKNE